MASLNSVTERTKLVPNTVAETINNHYESDTEMKLALYQLVFAQGNLADTFLGIQFYFSPCQQTIHK